MGRLPLRPVITSLCLLAAFVYGYILAFHRTVIFRDFDVHREFGRRFLYREQLYASDFCYAYQPIAAMYFSPLALMERNVGIMFRYGLAVMCLVATVFLFHQMVVSPGAQGRKDSYVLGGGAILLVSQFVLQDLDDGGPHVILLGILSLAIYSVWRKRECLGAVLFGLSIALKITPAIFLLLFFWKRQWRLLVQTILATAVWIMIPVLWMGPINWWNHQIEWTRNAISSVFDQQVEGRQQNEQRVRNQALRPTLLRYLVTYPDDHPMRRDDVAYTPILDLPPRIANGCVVAVALSLLGFFIWSSPRSFEPREDHLWPRDCSGLLVLALLFSPMTWQQHLAWLLPAAFVFLASARARGELNKLEWLMLGLYILLTMVLNYEVIGKSRFETLLSYHPFGVAMVLLFWLVISSTRAEEQLRPD